MLAVGICVNKFSPLNTNISNLNLVVSASHI